MKRLLIFVFLLSSICASAQVTGFVPYKSKISHNGIAADSLLYIPVKDTTHTPARKGAMTMRPQDSLVYIGISTTAPKKWDLLDKNTGGAVSDGDKGDVTISSSGTVYTIDNGTVGVSKADTAVGAGLFPWQRWLKVRDSLAVVLGLKVNVSDTATMLGNYIRDRGYGLLKIGQTLYADTAYLASRLRLQKVADSLAAIVPTLQQVLTAGSTLTGDFSVNTNGEFGIESTGAGVSFSTIGATSQQSTINTAGISLESSTSSTYKSELFIRRDSIGLLPNAGIVNIDSLRTLAAGDDEMMTWNPRTGVVSHQAIPSGSGGTYVDGGSFSTSTNYLTLTQTGASPDIGIRIPPSYLINPVNVDSLVFRRNDSVALIKSVTVSSANSKISVSTTRTDSTINHQVTVNEANFTTLAPLASPTFTGTPAAPTAAANTNTTQVATTAFVNAERSNTATLSNKRWTPRVGSTTSSATPTINTDNVDIYKLTAQTADITSFTTNLTGTPVDGDILEIQITGTAARAITWGSAFVASTVALPTTTVTTATLTVVFQYYTTSSYGNNKWVCASSY